jgi:eukaryotic-like serine/threonine-protein kinase
VGLGAPAVAGTVPNSALTIGIVGYSEKMSVGADLGRYRLISRIGAGGMATVDLAEDTVLGRRVALKRMGGNVDVSGLSRLRREALAGASLNHPNLVSVYDILTLEDGDLVIVMEYVKGETLGDRLTRQGAMPPSDALPIFAGVAAGLDAIHGAGIVHRDVKPSNILLGDDGAVKLADLGVASVPDRTQITTTGSIIGSLSYMAPEQLDDGPVTPAIDIYAFSAVAFEVLSGVRARDAPNPVALAHAIATNPAPRLKEAWPAAPGSVSDLLRRGMSREPRDRPRSAGELVAGLEAGLSGERTAPVNRGAAVVPLPAKRQRPQPAGRSASRPAGRSVPGPAARPAPRRIERAGPPPSAPGRTAADDRDGRRPWILAALALGLVCAAVALVVLLNNGSSPAPKTAASGTKSRTHRSSSHTSTSRSTSTPQAASSQSGSAAGSATSTASAQSGGTGSTAAGSTAAGSTAAGSATSGSGAAAPPGSATPPASPGAASATSPVGAVESFYQLAAAHRYGEAWALADPAFRSQLGGYRSFQAGQANDRSITFNSARVTNQTSSASTVAVSTTSVQSTKTSHCTGTVELVPGAAGRWMLHQIHINCS